MSSPADAPADSSLLDCCICLQRLGQSPSFATLPCLHSTCAPCFKELADPRKGSSSNPLSTCPMCRSPLSVEYRVEGGRIQLQLKQNLFVANLLLQGSKACAAAPAPTTLVGGAKSYLSDPNDIKCDVCYLLKEAKEDAVSFCVQCGQFLCEACLGFHQSLKASTLDDIVSIDQGLELMKPQSRKNRTRDPNSDDVDSSDKMKMATPNLVPPCGRHPREALRYFCERCCELCCTECIIDHHSTHGALRCSTAAQRLEESLSALITKVKGHADKVMKGVNEIVQTMEEVNERAKAAEGKIREVFEKLEPPNDERQAELMESLEKARHQKEKELLLQKDEVEFLLKGILHATSFAERLLDEGTEVDICGSCKEVAIRFATLENEVHKAWLTPVTDPMIDFELEDEWIDYSKGNVVVKDIGSVVTRKAVSVEKSRVVPITMAFLGWNTVLRVELVDRNGDKVKEGHVPTSSLQVRIVGPASKEVKATVKENPTNKRTHSHLASFTSEQLGIHNVSVLWKGQHVPGSPFKMRVANKPVYRCTYAQVADKPTINFGYQGEDPFSVACDTKGNIVVADCNNRRIQVLDKDGKFLFNFGLRGKEEGHFLGPCGVAVDHCSDNQIVVADTYSHRIQIFDEAGEFLFSFGSEGAGDGQFDRPHGVAVDQTTGNYFVADSGNHRVQVFGSDGEFIKKFGLEGNGAGQLDSPRGIALLSNGNVVVSEEKNNRLQVFTPEGEFVRMIGDGRGQLTKPQHVFVDSEDQIMVADYGNNQIQVFTQQGAHVKSIGGDNLSKPRGVCLDPQGRIIISQGGSRHRVCMFSSGFGFSFTFDFNFSLPK